MASAKPISASSDDPGYSPNPRAPKPPKAEAVEVAEVVEPEADVRLLIQEGEAGGYLYTVLDRSNGKVIAEIASGDVQRLMSKDAYAPGALIKTKA